MFIYSIIFIWQKPVDVDDNDDEDDDDDDEDESEEETTSSDEETSSEEGDSDDEVEEEEEEEEGEESGVDDARKNSVPSSSVHAVSDVDGQIPVDAVMETIEERPSPEEGGPGSLSSSSSEITISTPSEEPSGTSSGKITPVHWSKFLSTRFCYYCMLGICHDKR